ncbi:glycerate kinase [Paenibacillus alkalitolerans]|uniref:glycerate kinase n=1 Tax=Paenibacillus alkalitolerans TaxID=2799335 RepID=UPI0018F2D308|nr:glycerate kinase [Paenibacillus alkalitolerans]
MKIVIAPDSFKGSISSEAAAAAIEKGIKRFLPNAVTVKVPIADGGEGTLDSLFASADGRRVTVQVTGPMGAPVLAEYGVLSQSGVAVIEMAKASGLCLVEADERDPLRASTYGTGELIKSALDDGCRDFILAIGGSATNDGGAGMLQALGMRLSDGGGSQVGHGGGELGRIAAIDDSEWDPRIAESRFVIASDVQNPLVGPEGATHVFGPQKGASPGIVADLERNMTVWANTIERKTGVRLHDRPGAGAGGGIGGAFLAFFPASFRRGIDVMIEHSNFRNALRGADLVITGEGRIDRQTASGKTPMGIAQEARKAGVPVIALAGSVGPGTELLHEHGIHAVFSIVNGPMGLQQAMDGAAALLEQVSEQVLRTFCINCKPDSQS